MKKSEETIRHYTPAGGVTETKDSYNDFMCVCSPESKKKCEDCLARACEALDCKPGNLLSQVVYNITWDLPNGYVGSIDGIPCDMWCAVTGTISKGDEEPIQFFIQCDEVEHGIARFWEMATQAAKEK